jgi:hypothetical protein
MTLIPVRTLAAPAYRSCADLAVDIAALAMVDEAYLDQTEWVKKSIRTTAKVRSIFIILQIDTDGAVDGQVQLRSCDQRVC